MIGASSTSQELALPFRRNCNTLLRPSAADNRPFFLDGRPSAAHLNCQQRAKIIGIWQRVIRDTLMAAMAARRGSFFSERSSSVCTFYRVLNLPQALFCAETRGRVVFFAQRRWQIRRETPSERRRGPPRPPPYPLGPFLSRSAFFSFIFLRRKTSVFSTALTDVDDALT